MEGEGVTFGRANKLKKMCKCKKRLRTRQDAVSRESGMGWKGCKGEREGGREKTLLRDPGFES